ncbi:unnamed protein product [Heligmosomoides polygyrus]|uniref:Reverse transcriptase domain-containing protein n=1 Tax=Heligmosomoides polygyrus TaxID=6339 RepID=A0A183GAF5_HELPZ|nr:unnamed protein product [Heligmosomoides polygyrus]
MELLNQEFPRREAQEEQPKKGTIPPWTQEEKVLGDLGINWLTQFLDRITKQNKPVDWRNSTIVPIFKQKGDASECSNYRGIKLISHTMKNYERLVDSRLREMVPISQVQWDLMPERSTTDVIFIACQVMEKYQENQKLCYLAFLDLEKAHDRLPRPYSEKPFEGGVFRTSDHGHKGHVRRVQSDDTNSTRGSECWALGKAQERQLYAAEMRMLRWARVWTRRDRVSRMLGRQPKMREQRLW